MATTYKNYADFVKRQLTAVPVGVAQPQMGLTTVLQLKNKHFGTPQFDRVGNLTGLCARTGHEEQIKKDLANRETLEQYPFKKYTSVDSYAGCWNSKNSGVLGAVVPDTGNIGSWLKSYSKVKFTVYGITTYHLEDDYLLDIISTNKSWRPNIDSLKDFYVINEVVLTTKVTLRLEKVVKGGVGATLTIADINAANATKIGVNLSLHEDGILEIKGVEENGATKPFPIAFRCAHIAYKDDFTLKKPMVFGVRRGEHDGLHISGFVSKNEKYHIGEFFLNADDEGSDDEGSDDDKPGPEVVPINFDPVVSELVAE